MLSIFLTQKIWFISLMRIELIEYMLNEELTTSLETIDAAYQRQNWEQFKALVHKFKSSCLYCATTALLDLT